MKFGKQPLNYNWDYFNQSPEPLRSVYALLQYFNGILGLFTNWKATGDKYGFYLITNSLLICTQSLEKAIHEKNYNLLEILFRQSIELVFICDLLFKDMDNSDLAKIRTKERLKVYSAYCLWSKLRQLDKVLDRDQYISPDNSEVYTDEEINKFTELHSHEFQYTKDLINGLNLNREYSHLRKRSDNGENLYTFATVIDPKITSLSDIIRRTIPPACLYAYSIASSRIHGTWLSANIDENDSNVIKSSLIIPSSNSSESIINVTLENLRAALSYISFVKFDLWPKLLQGPNSNLGHGIFKTRGSK